MTRWIEEWWYIWRSALVLDPNAYHVIQTAPQGWWIAYSIVFGAGLFEALMQSLVLFLNRVTPRRFVVSLIISAGIFVVGYLAWVGSITAIARWGFNRSQPVGVVARAVGMGYAPMLLGWLALIPYFGSLVNRLLYVWTFVAIVYAISVTIGLPLWQAVACSVLGWVIMMVVQSTIGRPMVTFARWIHELGAGKPLIAPADSVPFQQVDDPD